MAISLVSKMFGSGLKVDRAPSSNVKNVYVPPPQTHGEGHYPIYQSPPFYGSWKNPIGAGDNKSSKKEKRSITRKNSPFNQISILGTVLCISHCPTLICLIW